MRAKAGWAKPKAGSRPKDRSHIDRQHVAFQQAQMVNQQSQFQNVSVWSRSPARIRDKKGGRIFQPEEYIEYFED
jgi:hypothetical protein